MIGLGKRKGIYSFICSLYYCELGHEKTMDDSISSMGTTSPTEMRLGVMLTEEQSNFPNSTNEECFKIEEFFKGRFRNLRLFLRLMCPGSIFI